MMPPGQSWVVQKRSGEQPSVDLTLNGRERPTDTTGEVQQILPPRGGEWGVFARVVR